jgi:hypothetical protein
MKICKNKWFSMVFIILLCCLISNVYAGPFEKGSSRVSFVVGSGYTLNESYVILGLGAGYFIVNGLELGLDGQAWVGGDPDIYKLKPQATYIVPTQSRIRPYAGVFYSRIFIDGYDDQDTAGARGGVYFTSNQKWFMGVGAVYESYLNCDKDVYSSCDDVYPEVTFSVSF